MNSRRRSAISKPRRLSKSLVVRAAANLADESGIDRLSLAALARELGIAVPSLYNHISGLDHLRAEVALLAIHELEGTLRDAAVGKAGADALISLARAYRAYARQHPGRYEATVRVATDDEALARERREAAEGTAAVVFAVLEGYGIQGVDLVDATRALRSILHGFITIDAAGGFGMNREVNRSFDAIIQRLDALLKAWPASN